MTFPPALSRLLTVSRHPPTQLSFGRSDTDDAETMPASAAGCETYPPDMHALFVLGEKMLANATRHSRSLSLLVLQLLDLPELQLLFGRAAADEVVDDVMTELTRVSDRRGFAVRTSADTFALLMPDMTGAELHRALQARIGKACAIEFELDEEEILLVPDVQSRTISGKQRVEEVYRAMCVALEGERATERRRRDHLRQTREAFTVPMILSAGSDGPARAREHSYGGRATLPATVPMSLCGPERRVS